MTFRLARRVGPSGRVVGIDVNESALRAARSRAAQDGVENVSFVSSDIQALAPSVDADRYDIVTCRRVLMYLPDKVRAVRTMLQALKPGGRLALQEHDASLSIDVSRFVLNGRVHRLIWDTVKAEGADIALGAKLPTILAEAGANDIEVFAEAVVQTTTRSTPMAGIVEVMADRIVTSGTATREEVHALRIETLEDRLIEERRTVGRAFIAEAIFGAYATKPAIALSS